MNQANTVKHPEPHFERADSLFIAGLDKWFTEETRGKGEIGKLWDEFQPYFGKVPGQKGHVAFGVVSNMKRDSDGLDYMAGVEVESIDGLPKELNHTHLPARTYAVFPHPGRVTNLRETLGFIFDDWLPKSGREIDVNADGTIDFFERYDEDFNGTDPGHIEIWMPIKA